MNWEGSFTLALHLYRALIHTFTLKLACLLNEERKSTKNLFSDLIFNNRCASQCSQHGAATEK